MKVAVVGSDARTHCFGKSFFDSGLVDEIRFFPGTAGTYPLGENTGIKAEDIYAIRDSTIENKLDVIFVSPEGPLVKGIVNILEKEGIKVFGPNEEMSQWEGSKIYSDKMMRQFGIPTPTAQSFDDPEKAKNYIKQRFDSGFEVVPKADGLCGGKGAIVCSTLQEAYDAVDDMMVKEKFGEAGKKILVQDRLYGKEASIMIVMDGEGNYIILPSSQDFKRVFNDDVEGPNPNTGGMAAVSPAPVMTKALDIEVENIIIKPFVNGLQKLGKIYRGIVYFALMVVNGKIYVLEINVRGGDPESQVVIPRIKNNFFDIVLATVNDELSQIKLKVKKDPCAYIVLASKGHPGSLQKGYRINGLDELAKEKDIFFYQAGTKIKGRCGGAYYDILTDGGRIMGIGAYGNDAITKIYNAIKLVSLDNGGEIHFRTDIRL